MTDHDLNNDRLHPESRVIDEAHLGLAGRTARFFIESPLSPLFFISMMMMGLLGLVMTPRQEDPQISVPMVDIFVRYSGASAEQVAQLAIAPLERIMSEIPGVKHVYSATERGQGIVTVEFRVGQKMGPSLVKVNDKLDSNMDKIPPGVSPPLVKAKGIDDVPVVTLTLWAKDLDNNGVPDVDDSQLRMLANSVLQSIKEIPDTGNGFVVGGRRSQVQVQVSPERLAGYGISLDQVAQTIRTANAETQAGGVEAGGAHFTVMTGSFLRTADDISRLVVGTFNNVPVYVHDVASVVQQPEDASQLVSYYTGPAGPKDLDADGVGAVTIAIAKKEGTNGVTVANAIINRVHDVEGSLIPENVAVSVTRDYGKTANDKVNELIFKLFVATGFVFFLVLGAFRAFRPALVVVLVIPVVLLFTVFLAWVTGFTIDRVSLFALIFAIGILVDDAIVVIENIYRRWLEEGRTDRDTAVDAVREVGNPTILATFTVIGALLPMGFVRGMMGPYMMPIPALGSMAMFVSLFAAFVFTPWLAMSRWLRPSMHYLKKAEKREHEGAEKLEGLYRRVLTPMIEDPRKARLFRLALWGALIVAFAFFYFKWVAVKMLPLDNKPEFSVVLNMPEGTALPVTANMAGRIADKIRTMPEVTAIQTYAGCARPFDFNGMVRHYYLRDQPWQGEIQVQLLDKGDRKRSSHQIAVAARQMLQDVIQGSGARIAVVEMPPGPPVLQSVVAEVHGPSAQVRRQFARDLTDIFSQTESLRDVDNYMRRPYEYWRFVVDTEKAVRRGISVDAINRNLSMALGGTTLGDVKQRAGHEPINIVIEVPLAERSQIQRLGDLPVQSQSGSVLPLRELGHFEQTREEDVIYQKDLRPIEYVTADVGGHLAAPVYGMFQVEDLMAEKDYVAPDGTHPAAGNMLTNAFYWLGPPPDDTKSAIEWTGEWTVTYETFRDMGAAFMAALVLIYVLVVWEFGNFRIPALIMAPIPLTLLGIIPIHAVFFQLGQGGEFTATSMIGWIALAGIIVRNSILLVDFSIHEVQRGTPVAEAVIRSCKTRTRPIMITALALVAGSSVIFFDPIFQGMAISLASGVMVSTILTLVVIPLGCIKASRSLCEVAAAGCRPGTVIPELEELKAAAAKPAPAKARPRAAKMPIWMRLWAVLANVLMFVFYAVRGVVLLVLQMFKRKPKPRPRTPPPPPAAAPKPSSPGGAGGGAAPSGGPAPVVSGGGGLAPAKASAAGPAPSAAAPVQAPFRPSAQPTRVAAAPKAAAATLPESVPAAKAVTTGSDESKGPVQAQPILPPSDEKARPARPKTADTATPARPASSAPAQVEKASGTGAPAQMVEASPTATIAGEGGTARAKPPKKPVEKPAEKAPTEPTKASSGPAKAPPEAKRGSAPAKRKPAAPATSASAQSRPEDPPAVAIAPEPEAAETVEDASSASNGNLKRRAARRGIRLKGVEPPAS